MSQFYVGQKAVCVKTHSHGVTRKGVMYVVKAITTCRCGIVALDLGICVRQGRDGTRCYCGRSTSDGVWWQHAIRFHPLDALTEQLDRIESEPIEEHVEEKVI